MSEEEELLVIRLARTGKKKQAYFRVVVAEKERAVGAKFVEVLGNYNPHLKKLEIKKERLEEFLKNGAHPSNRLAIILKKEGIKLPNWVKIKEKNKAPKKSEEKGKEESVKEINEDVSDDSKETVASAEAEVKDTNDSKEDQETVKANKPEEEKTEEVNN